MLFAAAAAYIMRLNRYFHFLVKCILARFLVYIRDGCAETKEKEAVICCESA